MCYYYSHKCAKRIAHAHPRCYMVCAKLLGFTFTHNKTTDSE